MPVNVVCGSLTMFTVHMNVHACFREDPNIIRIFKLYSKYKHTTCYCQHICNQLQKHLSNHAEAFVGGLMLRCHNEFMLQSSCHLPSAHGYPQDIEFMEFT